MEWNIAEVRRNAWDTTFKRGWRAWLALVAVCFIFAFVGANNASQTKFIDGIDRLTGTSDILQTHNMEVLDTYARSVPWVHDLLMRNPQLAEDVINGVTETSSWIVRVLALNPRYFDDNPSEVFAAVLIVAFISIFIRFCVLNVFTLGQHRYVMETRYVRHVPWRRMLAPFHLDTLLNVLRVMVCYHATMLMWWITIVGGFYKSYQYRMVPLLLAENPHIGWREARQLSTHMTDGYKWKMFLTDLSYLHITLLRLVPLLGIGVSVPLNEELQAEMYFTLRANPALRDTAEYDLFVERAFDAQPYVRLTPEQQLLRDEEQPTYLLKDLDIDRRKVRPKGLLPYAIVDLIYIFIIFCFVGWVWEVGLHFYQAHEFVNRGTLYGPWIPIYGVGGTAMVVFLDRFSDQPMKVFALGVGLSAVLEYATSFILDFMFNASYWSYDNMLFNVNGRICLAGLLAFGFGGLVATYLAAPFISRKVGELPPRTRYLGAAALALAFCSDLAYCVIHGFNSGAGVGEDL